MTTATAERRAGRPDDAVGEVVPRQVVRPGSVPEVVEVLRAAASDGLSVVPVGGRTKTSWAAAPTSCDVLLDTTGLDRVVEHVAGDLIVVAEAGVRLSDLQDQLAGAGQLLGLDPPEQGATLGGVVSANASGPRRLRYGTARDLLIGTTVVLADGTVASAGGKVVKNVAGYDLGKLYTGAHGTLGVVVSTTWRLHPVAPATRAVVVELTDTAQARPLVQQLTRSTLTPSLVELVGTAGGAGRLVVGFESIPESVAAQARTAVELLGGGSASDALPAEVGQRPGGPGEVRLRIAHLPTALPQVLAALPSGSPVSASAATGVTYAAIPAAESAAALAALPSAIAAGAGAAAGGRPPPAARDSLDHWGPAGDALGLMRRVKDRFDPDHRMSPGRFVGGI